jgi:hypothetical protein
MLTRPIFKSVGYLCCEYRCSGLYGLFVEKGDAEGVFIWEFRVF